MKYFAYAKFFAFMLLFLLISCADKPSELLKVGVNQWPGYEPMFLARDLGYLPKHKVKLVELPSSTESITLLRGGRLDAAALTLDEALSVMDMGTELTIVLVFDFSNGADVLLAKPSLKTLADIRNHRVGVESTGVGALLFYAALNHAGLESDDVQVVYVPADEHEEAYTSGKVDAVVTFEPIESRLKQHGAHVLFDSRVVPDLIVDVLAVRTEQLEKQRENIFQLVQAYAKARAYMEQHAEKSVNLMAPRLHITTHALQQTYQDLILPSVSENIAYFSGSPSKFERHTREVYDLMRNRGMIKHQFSVSHIQDKTFVTHVKL
ncbi:ABC transporter substrate-binding protein [Ghiorsea bivora]|uniref:ABC transporter substrate-binding protein n=1 Tax=Ghiorsea bivora TaxID=1485545 RepID=UPI00068C7BA8|nr:ABC transporter substrate-binding protein [Ghiorsea bivora]